MDYKYEGLELTPAIFSDLLIQLLDGKQFSRKDAIEKITNYHLENGGLLNKPSYVSAFKKAVQMLNDNGMKNVGYGIWRLNYEEKSVEIISQQENNKEEKYSADKEIGDGKNAVYIYYYDCYKDFAESKGNNVWECKIGRTDVDPISRVFSQAGTCYPELPHLALIIHCDDSALLEKALHSILRLQDKWISTSPGTEWFMTSPEEIEIMYNQISNK